VQLKPPIRIANCSGFYGDRLSAAKEMVEGGPIDVLTGDWLAELTMLILAKDVAKNSDGGFAKSFVRQMDQVMALCLNKGIKVVANAGGLNPKGCAAAVKNIAERQGLKPKIAWIGGDDLLPRLDQLSAAGHPFTNMDTGEPLGERKMLTANAYLGGWGIVEALRGGADIVITGRTTDAALVAGPAAWHHEWSKDDYDKLAGAIIAGHVIECGAQATGGNFSFFQEVPGLAHPGFPIAEIAADGSSVITKHAQHGGLVSIDTVTAQLLYEIAEPAYKNPDVTARFDTITLETIAPNRVRISGARGEKPPANLKVVMNYQGGSRAVLNMAITGLDAKDKAQLYLDGLWSQFPKGQEGFAESHTELIRGNLNDPLNNEEHTSILRIVVKDMDERLVEVEFLQKNVELGLCSYPGLYSISSSVQKFGVCWPTLIPAELITQSIHIEDALIELNCAAPSTPNAPVSAIQHKGTACPDGQNRLEALGRLFGARSGDKAGNANLGVWARSDAAYAWLEKFLTIEKLQGLMPEARHYPLQRFLLPNLRSVNFVFKGLLGEGVAASTRLDAQAKSLGEYFRAIKVELPCSLLDA
jgi:hypothetical protein